MNKKKKSALAIIATTLIALFVSCTSCPATEQSLINSLNFPAVPDPLNYNNPACYDSNTGRYSVLPAYWIDIVKYIIDADITFTVIRENTGQSD